MFATDLDTEYHRVRKHQSLTIGKCLQHLHSIGIEYDFDFNSFDPVVEYKAWKFTKKHWRKLRIANVEWIKAGQYKCHYALGEFDDDGGTLFNLSKGESHQMTWEVDALICDCEGFQYSGHCSHVEFALENLDGVPTAADMAANIAEGNTDEELERYIKSLQETEIKSTNEALRDLAVTIMEVSGDITAERANTLTQIPVRTDKVATIAPPPGPVLTEPVNITEILPGIVGTTDQVKALPQLVEFAKSGNAIHGLFGVAGSGKTTVLQAMIQQLRDSSYTGQIVFTAPTNKAVSVLKSMADRWDLGIDCQTCAKLLALKPRIDSETGEQFFEPDSKNSSTIGNYQLVVVDECSMVSSTSRHKGLWEYLVEAAGFFTKLLFVGDHCQLPPVNEAISQVFLNVQNPSWLTEVKRYDGAVAEIADQIRQNLSRQARPRFKTSVNDDRSKGFFVLKRDRWFDSLVQAFSSDKFLLDPSYVKALAYTNERVKYLNSYIREAIHGKNAPRFKIGDRLIANRPFFRDRMGESQGFPVSMEMEVMDTYEGSEGNYQCWNLVVQLFDCAGTRIVIPVLHEDSQARFKSAQAELKAQKQHLAYHKNLEYWAWVDHAYAITVHSSQGSTFGQVFVDVKNILRDKTRNTFTWPDQRKELIWERNQLLYVALTRASHRIFIYE
ncbi:MAG: AAA family ATPase [Cyanobacteria bacterium P01_F01_bin.56]